MYSSLFMRIQMKMDMGANSIFVEACTVPDGFVNTGTDCNDTDENAYPGAEEICDGIDNDCDDEIDEELGLTFTKMKTEMVLVG